MSASQLKTFSAFDEAKVTLAKAVEPEIVAFTDCKESNYVSTTDFQKKVKKIQAKTSTHIKVSASSLSASSIAIYGTPVTRERAKLCVEQELKRVLGDGVECFEVNLKEQGKPGIMKHLISQYGSDLGKLSATIKDVAAARLNPRRQLLTLFATEAGYEAFLDSLDQFKPECPAQQAQPPQGGETSQSAAQGASECCVCFQTHHSTPFYRLELCGHVYCRECIQQQLEASIIEFPVTCAADKCEEQLVWQDFENLDKVIKLHDVTSASLKAYMARNMDKVRNCITPDCQMVYAVSSESERFVCRRCGANICTKCHTAWHEGFDTCEAYKNRESGDAQLRWWMRGDRKNRKNCPTCSAPIEKISGCHHMICSKCKMHMNWDQVPEVL